MKRNVCILLLLGYIFFSPYADAQKGNVELTIDSVGVDDGRPFVELYFKLLADGLPVEDVRLSDITIEEKLPNEEAKAISKNQIKGSIDTSMYKRKLTVDQDTFNILFLVEQSSQLEDEKYSQIEEMIETLVSAYTLSKESTYFLSTYNGNKNINLKTINKTNYSSSVELKKDINGKANLYEALNTSLRELNGYPGKKIVFLFSSGAIETIERPGHIPIDQNDVIRTINGIQDESLFIFPVKIGTSIPDDFLASLPTRTTRQLKDQYTENKLPDNLNQIFKNSEVYIRTHKIRLIPNKNVFAGEERLYTLKYTPGDKESYTLAQHTFKRGFEDNPVILNPLYPLSWAFSGLGGGFILFLTLLAFLLLFPYLRKRHFMSDHVHEYQEEQGKKIIDPLTSRYIESGEKIVTKCQQISSFQTWQDVGWQCPNYPNCMKLYSCNGSGAPESNQNFFDMQGIFRKMNWLWFGALGGFIGWGVYALLKSFGFGFYKGMIEWAYQTYSSIFENAFYIPRIEDMASVAILSASFGVGLIFALAWVEERSQSRSISWFRIILRTVIGTILTSIVFFIGFYIQFVEVVKNSYLDTLLTWTLFGIVVGFVLSIKSSIPVLRGILGGLISSIVAYVVYIGIFWLISDGRIQADYLPFIQLLRLLIMGAILGYVLVTIVNANEDYEIEYLSPSKYSRIVPISKWLKSGIAINIGTQQGSYIYIKWPDAAVEPLHAELLYEKGEVFILPFAEVLVGRDIIPKNKKTRLRPGQIIKLGRESKTQMRLNAKTSQSTPQNTHRKIKNKLPVGKAKLDLRFNQNKSTK